VFFEDQKKMKQCI